MTEEEKSLYDILEDEEKYTDDDFEYDTEDGENYNTLKMFYLTTLIKAIHRYEALTDKSYFCLTDRLQAWAEYERIIEKDRLGTCYSFYEFYHDQYGNSALEKIYRDDFEINIDKYVAECEKAWYLDLCDVEFMVKFGEIADELAREQIFTIKKSA